MKVLYRTSVICPKSRQSQDSRSERLKTVSAFNSRKYRCFYYAVVLKFHIAAYAITVRISEYDLPPEILDDLVARVIAESSSSGAAVSDSQQQQQQEWNPNQMDFGNFSELTGFGQPIASPPLLPGQTGYQPLLPQELWQMSGGLDWDWAEFTGGAYPSFENGSTMQNGR